MFGNFNAYGVLSSSANINEPYGMTIARVLELLDDGLRRVGRGRYTVGGIPPTTWRRIKTSALSAVRAAHDSRRLAATTPSPMSAPLEVVAARRRQPAGAGID